MWRPSFCFPKGKIDSKKVRVEFSLEDMDMSGFQKGAAYEQVKEYVLEKFGLQIFYLLNEWKILWIYVII